MKTALITTLKQFPVIFWQFKQTEPGLTIGCLGKCSAYVTQSKNPFPCGYYHVTDV